MQGEPHSGLLCPGELQPSGFEVRAHVRRLPQQQPLTFFLDGALSNALAAGWGGGCSPAAACAGAGIGRGAGCSPTTAHAGAGPPSAATGDAGSWKAGPAGSGIAAAARMARMAGTAAGVATPAGTTAGTAATTLAPLAILLNSAALTFTRRP
mmetsp:Transcript_35980/g.110708  ORF Transcript_35980/g.110708 Transcript_35980/m.110708 type:complete len:153 (-) Transcript_35980:376-834(-)